MNFRIKPYLSKLLSQFAASEKWQRLGFAMFSTLIILSLVKIPIKRYLLELLEGQVLHQSEFSTYLADDLDNDGNTERIYLYNSPEGERLTLMMYDHQGLIKETINFPNHDWTPNSFPAVYDIDGDNIKEVLLVSIKKDSVFLNAINLFTSQFLIADLFLGSIERPQPEMAYGTRFLAFDDFNNDGQKELYFRFDAGYGLKPRGIFRIDIHSMELYRTPDSYIVWNHLTFKDLDNDGIPEILPYSYAPCNVPFETEYTDQKAWICAFDLELNYLFPPIPMANGHGTVIPSPATFSDSLFFVLYSNNSTDTIHSQIFLLNLQGEILNEQSIFRGDPTIYSQTLEIIDDKNYLLINNIGKFELTPELENLPQKRVERQKKFTPYEHIKYWDIDINSSGISELFYYNVKTSVAEIRNQQYKLLTTIQLPFDRLRITNVYPYFINGKIERLMVVTDSGYFFMQYTENPFYWTKYLVWLGIFLATGGFIYLVQYFQRKRMEQNWETEKQLTELQFSSIRSQLNPHFIFNSLNSIGYLIENGKKDEAYDFLSVNSRMIRHILEDAEMTTQSLNKEIEFVRDYLSVQKFRFGDKLEYTFDVDPLIELTLVVPKMIIHTYVENAVKHGLKNHKGKICIKCEKIPHGLKLMISDNGIGITHAENSPQNTGKGLSIMDKYYRLFEKEFNCKIHTTIDEIKEVGNSGTEVVITIEYLS